jgi:uncharacterized protein YbjT (DUF2867 family)
MFEYRHRVTADDLAAHAACRGGRAMKVAITGSSGLVGSALVPFLTTGGHEVVRLVRRAPRGKDEVRWDPEARTIDAAALEGIDAVVNLSGENIAERRWSGARKAATVEPAGADPAPGRDVGRTEAEAEGAHGSRPPARPAP